MAWFKQPFDPVKNLEVDEGIPKSLIDLPQIIAEKQAKKIWGRGLTVDSEDKAVLEFLNEFIEENRLREQILTIEELKALFGQVIVTLE